MLYEEYWKAKASYSAADHSLVRLNASSEASGHPLVRLNACSDFFSDDPAPRFHP
jgi:hypothetical protein